MVLILLRNRLHVLRRVVGLAGELVLVYRVIDRHGFYLNI